MRLNARGEGEDELGDHKAALPVSIRRGVIFNHPPDI
jgi:hypothetical protein